MGWRTWREATEHALYGDGGFYRRTAGPAAHFRTSVHASPRFAEAVLSLARAAGLTTVVDMGAGGGELLVALHALDPSLDLVGVELADRPPGLADEVRWTAAAPGDLTALVVANEWLDNIPCHVVEVDASGVPRVVHVDPSTGRESLGSRLTDRVVPPRLAEWCAQWWPLDGAAPGARAEVGTTRDDAWADVVRRVTRGVAVAVDYGHVAPERPPLGSMRSYRAGREVDVLPNGSRDVTAHVAVDAVASRVGGSVLRQREALRALGVSGARPDLALATSDPQGYVKALSGAGEAAELTDEAGLGAFFWVVSTVADVPPAEALLG